MTTLVLRDARLVGTSVLVDITMHEGVVTAVTPAGMADARGAQEVALAGRWVTAGLWDAHVHFAQWARARTRIDVSAATSAADVCAVMGAEGGEDLRVGFGFRWATWAEPPTLEALDAARPAPTVVLSGDLHTAWVNTAAARDLGVAPGVLVEDPAFEAERRLDSGPVSAEALADAVRAAHARGVVGIVDLELADNAAVWQDRYAAGATTMRVETCFYPELLDDRIRAGVRTGDAVVGTAGMIRHGSLKVITDGSLNSRSAHCLDPYADGTAGLQNVSPEALTDLMRRAHGAGIRSAVHAIGDAANRIALDAFAATGARGSIEHAQLLADADVARFAALGVTASVQPEHAVDDRDATDRIWSDRAHRAYPLRSLRDAGAVLAFGSDAPVAPLDPWRALAAAVFRTGDERAAWHPEQCLTVRESLDASSRHHVTTGAPADVVVVDHDPCGAPASVLREMRVALTVVGGRVVHHAM